MSAIAEQINGKPPDGAAAAQATKGPARPSTQYPKFTLQEAIAVPRAIEEQNAGRRPPDDARWP